MPAPPSPAAQAKICTVCGKDCSTIDRVKDADGRYTCKPCHDAKRNKSLGGEAGAGSAPRAPDIASIYERPESRPCPQCDKPVPHDAEICVACGYNLRAGRPVKTKLGRNDPNAAARAAAAGAVHAKPKRWLYAAIAGGFVGALAWAGAAYFMSDGAAWMGAIAPALAGLAVFLAAREHCSGRSLAYALAFALLFGAIGKAGSAGLLTLVAGPKHPGEITLTEDSARGLFAHETAEEWTKQGKQLYWPSGFGLENAKIQEHYPPEVWQDAMTKWESNGTNWQRDYRTSKMAVMQFEADQKFSDDRKASFLARFDWWDAMYGGVGLLLAGLLGGGVLNLIRRS